VRWLYNFSSIKRAHTLKKLRIKIFLRIQCSGICPFELALSALVSGEFPQAISNKSSFITKLSPKETREQPYCMHSPKEKLSHAVTTFLSFTTACDHLFCDLARTNFDSVVPF